MADLPTIDLEDFGLSHERSIWDRFKDAYGEAALHSPIGAEGLVRMFPKFFTGRDLTPAQLNAIEKRLSEQYARKREADPAMRVPSQAGLIRSGVDLMGSLLGGADPTYALSPGKTAAQRIAAQAGINAGVDAASQGIEVNRGVRDKFDPREVAINAAAGGLFQSGGEAISHANLGRRVARGSSHPDWQAVNDVIVNDLEGGGTLSNPKVSKKGAMGPQQVMLDTARDPGFGIRPWNGKTQADLARVGRQYSAAMMDKYNGDTAKVFAAYNAGPGRVDAAIKAHGSDWLDHMPGETRKYVQNGMRKIGTEVGPDSLGPVDLVKSEQPSVHEQALANDRLAPSDQLEEFAPHEEEPDWTDPTIFHDDHDGPSLMDAYDDPSSSYYVPEELPENVTDLGQVRHDKRVGEDMQQIDYYHDIVDDFLDHIRSGGDVDINDVKGVRGELEKITNGYFPSDPQWHRLHDLDDKLSEAEQYLRNPVVKAKPMDSSHEKFTRNPEVKEPANLNDDRFVGKLPKEGLAPASKAGDGKIHIGVGDGYVTKDGTYLTREQAKKYVKETDMPQSRNLVQLIKDLLGDEEGSLKGSGDAEGPERKRLKLQKKLVLDKLGDALEQSTPLRREAEAAISKERSRRLAAAYKARGTEGGQAGTRKALAALKGEMGRPKIESIRPWFTEHEIDVMHDGIWNSPNLTGYEPIRASKALDKLLGASHGEIPTASEIELLAKAMPQKAKIWKQLLENEEGSLNLPDSALKKNVIGALNIPKTLMASYDISAPLRQGVFMIGRKQFYTSLGPMLRALVSPKFDRSVKEAIFRDPLFEEMRSSGLAVPADVGHNGGPRLADLEEAYQTQLAQKIPIVGIGVRASERAYTTFIYKLRADTFKAIYNAAKATGKEWDTKSLHDLSRFINTFTGRGSLGRFNNMSPQLNVAMFSPRLLKSRIDVLNPVFYAKLDPVVQKEAFKSIASFAVIAGSILGLAHLAGAEVDPDIRKPDGWKIKIGNNRHDILGGEQQLLRLMANIGTYSIKAGKELYDTGKLKKGNPFNNRTALDNIGQFLRNKESPDVSFAHDFAAGNNAIGQDFVLKEEALSRITPMAPADVYDAVADLQRQGVPVDEAIIKGTLKTLDAWAGISVQTYPPKQKKDANAVDLSDFGVTKTVSLKDFE